MSTQHFNATETIEKLQRKREIRKQRQCSQSILKKHRAEIVALLKAPKGSYRLVAEWLKTEKHLKVSHTTIMRFAKKLPEMQEVKNAEFS